jgi:pimeloyl-ACP methyl ester carboxylesterase
MRRKRAGLLAVGLAVAAMAGVCGTVVAAGPDGAMGASSDHGNTGKRTVHWKPCAKNKAAECGTLRLPVDWDKPDGATFDLALARRKATAPKRRIGALVYNMGNGAGVDAVVGDPKHPDLGVFRNPKIQEQFDVIGFDPRGTGRSHPVKCSADLVNRVPIQPPHNQAEFDRLRATNAKLGADCRRRTGPLMDHLDAASTARDIDAIRAALGERKISYHGTSYGTTVGEAYAELFGRNLRAMVLDSVVDHSLGSRDLMLTDARNQEAVFRAFVRWCQRDRKCVLHGRDVTKIWEGLLAKADRGELRDPHRPNRSMTAFDLANDLVGMSYWPTAEGMGWKAFAQRIAAMESGKPGPEGPRARPDQGAGKVVSYETAAFCQDWRVSIRNYRQLARIDEQVRRVAPHTRNTISMAPYSGLPCLGLTSGVNNPQHRLKVHDAPTMLLINSLYDPATGHDFAVNVHRQIRRNSVLATYEGAGHITTHRTACTQGVVDRYLLGLRVPADGTRCPAEPALAGLGN